MDNRSMYSRRGNPYPSRYKDGKVEDTITIDEFENILQNAREYEEKRRKESGSDPLFKDVSVVGLLAVLYWTGLRISEIVGDIPHKYVLKDSTVRWTKPIKGIVKKDVKLIEEEGLLRIKAEEVRKHGKRDEPLWMKINDLGVNEFIKQWEKTPKEGDTRVFPISKVTAWRFVREVTGNLYPHFFRLNLATKFAESPETTILDLQKWFGWVEPRTIVKYMGKAGRTTRKMVGRVQ